MTKPLHFNHYNALFEAEKSEIHNCHHSESVNIYIALIKNFFYQVMNATTLIISRKWQHCPNRQIAFIMGCYPAYVLETAAIQPKWQYCQYGQIASNECLIMRLR